MCTVGVRICELLDGKDKWWQLGEDAAIADATRSVEMTVLAFLKRMRSREAMAQWLSGTGVTRKKLPMPIIVLAIIEHILGDHLQSTELLDGLQARSVGAWKARAAEVAARLRCG